MTSKLVQALSRLAGNRQSDGTSSLISGEDREAIISGCYDLMLTARQAPPENHLQAAIAYHEAKASEIWNTDNSGFSAERAKEFGIAWCIHAMAAYDLKKLSLMPPENHVPVAHISEDVLHTLKAGGSGVFPITATSGPSHRPQCTVPLYLGTPPQTRAAGGES